MPAIEHDDEFVQVTISRRVYDLIQQYLTAEGRKANDPVAVLALIETAVVSKMKENVETIAKGVEAGILSGPHWEGVAALRKTQPGWTAERVEAVAQAVVAIELHKPAAGDAEWVALAPELSRDPQWGPRFAERLAAIRQAHGLPNFQKAVIDVE